MKSIKPRKLKAGDTIGLVSPASLASPEKMEKAINNMERLGLQVRFGKNARKQKGYLAGEDHLRLNDLHQFFEDDQIDGIWCIRGGYGSARLLPQLNYQLIRKNPKVFIGYSDITAVLNAINQKSGLVGFHGPVATSNFSEFALQHLQSTLFHSDIPKSIEVDQAQKYTIVSGKAQGLLAGGNLSLIAALCGGGYLPKFKNRIIFLEDIGEKPYRIDRMLTQLLQSTDLAKAAAIVLGKFEDCEAAEGDLSLSLEETFRDRLGLLDIPVIYGFPFGHIADNATLPIGIQMEIDTTTGSLRFLEKAVTE